MIREVIRATALSRFNYDVGSYPYRVDWGSVAMFTVTTIVGVSIITYMVMVLFQSGIGAGERIPRGIDRLGRISTAMLGAWFAQHYNDRANTQFYAHARWQIAATKKVRVTVEPVASAGPTV